MSLASAYREPVDPPGVDAFRPETDSDEQAHGVNGRAFDKAARTVNHAAIPDVPGLDAEPFPALKPWQHAASGAVIMEPDGRIWVVAPRGGYAGYDNTFPKGTVDKDGCLTMQQNAHKEVQEESGLCIKLKGVVGDFAGDQSVTRYYLAERVGGSPYHHDGKETAAVKLATPEQLRAMLNKNRDRRILHVTQEKFSKEGTKISAANPPGQLGRAAKSKRDDTLNISKWKKVGGSLGSNPGGLYEDEAREKWYVKHSKSDDHARNEVLAAMLYAAAGSPVLDYHLTKDASGKLGTATPWVDKKAFDPNSPADRANVQAHFATHAWLANWDAVGLVFDNQAIVVGKMTTLDTGGALRYRAQGSPKLFSEHPTEWSSLRDSAKNPQAAAVFGKMTDRQLADSVVAVASVPDGVIDELVKKFGPPDPTENAKLATTLKARKLVIKSNGAAAATPANLVAIPAALPLPVKVTSVAQAVTYQPKFDAVDTAATTLSPADAIAKISAIESKPDSKVTWGKKFHAYKTLVLAALGAEPGKHGVVAAHTVVIAGPGAGKTKTLVARVNHLLATKVRPRDIVVITYTNAAAAEIVKRLDGATIGFCGTLHGFMLRQLRQFGSLIGLPPELAVVSEAQRIAILTDVVAEIRFKGSRKDALEAIQTNPLLNRKGPPGLPKLMLLAASYHRRMLENGLLDFDSILAYGRAVLDTAPSVATHLLVDEFQDASDADDDIYSALRIANKFFVGDPDQAIYGFRGGNPANFMRRAALPGTSLFYLEKNYRCGVQICAAANRLILHNKDRLPKQSVPVHVHDSSTVETMRCATEAAELARLTQAIIREPSFNVAVLCRTNALATRIADHLEGCGVRVARKAKRTHPNDWPLVRQCITLLCNPDNDLLAYAWIKYVAGEHVAKDARKSALAALTTINRADGPPRWPTPTLAELPDALAAHGGGWREEIDLVKRTIAELPAGSTLPDLALALAADDTSNDEVGEGVTVTTLHSAKGREWDSVYLPGWVEGLMPSKRGDEAEERRLAFVGITRARQRLVILWPAEVRDHWTHTDSETEPSRFIKEAGL